MSTPLKTKIVHTGGRRKGASKRDGELGVSPEDTRVGPVLVSIRLNFFIISD